MHTRNGGPILVFGHLLFGVLAVLALVHWRLRVIHVDSAWQFLKWIQLEGLSFEAHRYSALAPQLLVKLLALLGAGLPTLMKAASMAHIIVPWLLFAFVGHVLRRPWHAAALAISLVLCTRLAFYGMVLEAHYLLSYPLVLAAALDDWHDRRSSFSFLAALVALLCTVLVHPLGAPVAVAVILMQIVARGSDPLAVGLLIPTASWPFLARVLWPATGYEQDLYSGMMEGVASSANPAVDFIIHHSWRDTFTYLPWWCMLVLLITLLARRRRWLFLSLALVSVSALLLITFITYHRGDSAVMMEKNFLPLAILVALPLALLLRDSSLKAERSALAALVVVAFVQVRGISFASREMGARYERVEALVDAARTAKGFLRADGHELDRQGLHVHWALPAEVLLSSALAGPDRSVILEVQDGGGVIRLPVPQDALDRRWFRPVIGPCRVD